MAAKKAKPATVEHVVEIGEGVFIEMYLDWHIMHALRCEVGHGPADDGGNRTGTVHISPGYVCDGANVAAFFGDDLSEADFGRIVGKIEKACAVKFKPGLYELGELVKRGLAVKFGDD